MNEADIAERFIRAAEIYRAMPEHVGPQQPRSVDLGYAHDWLDKLGWGTKRLEEERKEFWERLGFRASSDELSQMEIIRAWLIGLSDQKERRALLAWARAKAGGMRFKKWCMKIEQIHPGTGRRRKDRAISRIRSILDGKPLQNNETLPQGVLLDTPENDYLDGTFGEPRREAKPPSWRDDPSLAPVMDDGHRDFSWAGKRNARRRQLATRREQQSVAAEKARSAAQASAG